MCVRVCVCAAFPLGYFPGTTFHGTDKAAMAAASAAAAAFADIACVAAAAGVAVGADSELGNTSGNGDGAERKHRERKRERASEQGKFLSTRASLRATAATAATAPGAVGNKIFDASCPSLRAGMCVEVCAFASVCGPA